MNMSESQKGIYVYPGMHVSAETYCETYGIETMLDLDDCDLSSRELRELELYLNEVVHIELERDYEGNNGKAVLVRLHTRECMNKGNEGEADIALIRIQSGKKLYWYESGYGEHIGWAPEDNMGKRSIDRVYKFLLGQFPEADIDMSEVRKGEALVTR